MGIDFPTKDELIAGRLLSLYGDKYLEEIQKKTGSDTLLYQTIDDLTKAIGMNRNQLCLACLTGDYPLKSVQKLAEMEKEGHYHSGMESKLLTSTEWQVHGFAKRTQNHIKPNYYFR